MSVGTVAFFGGCCSGHQFPEHWSKKLCLLLLILAVKIVIRASRPSITRNLLKCDHVTTGGCQGVKWWNMQSWRVFFPENGKVLLEETDLLSRPGVTRKDSNTTTPKPRQQELQKRSNSTTFGEMARRRFARSCLSGAGTYFGKSHPTKASPKFRHGSLKSHFLFYFQFFLLRWTLIKKRCVGKNEDRQMRIQSQSWSKKWPIDAKCLGMLQPIKKKKIEKDGASGLSLFPFSPKQFERPFVSETLPQWVP